MTSSSKRRFRLGLEQLEDRAVPAFLAAITSPGGGDSLVVGDVNHDGRADVAVIGQNNSVKVSLSNGDGTFRPVATLTGATGTLLGLAISDWWNRDGHPDVVGVSTRAQANYTNIWPGNGDGTFGPVSTFAILDYVGYPDEGTIGHPHPPNGSNKDGGGPKIVANSLATVADFNRDGTWDMASISQTTGVVTVELRNPDGTYQPATSYAAGPSPGSIAAGDFNGDGWIDIVVVNNLSSSSPTLSVLLNDGIWLESTKAAGADLAAKRSPHRPGISRALGLRARSDDRFIVSQTDDPSCKRSLP